MDIRYSFLGQMSRNFKLRSYQPLAVANGVEAFRAAVGAESCARS